MSSWRIVQYKKLTNILTKFSRYLKNYLEKNGLIRNFLFIKRKSYSTVSKSETINGASIVAKSLKEHGIEYMFGVAGIPVTEIAFRAQQNGIKYVGMRNEQSVFFLFHFILD